MPPELIAHAGAELFPMLPLIGLTSYFDAGMMQLEDMVYPALPAIEAAGKLPVRIVGSYMVQSPAQEPVAIEKITEFRAAYGSELVHPNTIKIHNNGTLEARTAALSEDYDTMPGNKDGILLSGDVLQYFVTDNPYCRP